MSRNMQGPDHKSSLEPKEFKKLVKLLRNTEIALGTSEKKPTKSEIKNSLLIRRSLVALRPIKKGELFNNYNVGSKRPGTGISPMRINEIMGKKSKHNFTTDEIIRK